MVNHSLRYSLRYMSTSTVLLANLVLLALLSPSIILLLYLMAKTAKETNLCKKELNLYKEKLKLYKKELTH